MSVRAAALAAILGVGGGAGTSAILAAPGEVVEGIPNRALYAYVNAAAVSSCGVEWQDLAAIGVVESGHGTHGGAHIDADGVVTRTIGSSAGAQGPMQFMPETWASYVDLGVTDGDGDGVSNVDDIDDAARASAEYLCRNGYVAGDRAQVVEAWGAYNGGAGWRAYQESRDYVAQAAFYADAYATGGGEMPAGTVHVSAPTPRRDRSFGRFAEGLWSIVVDGWEAVGRSDSPAVRDGWKAADDRLFGEEKAS